MGLVSPARCRATVRAPWEEMEPADPGHGFRGDGPGQLPRGQAGFPVIAGAASCSASPGGRP